MGNATYVNGPPVPYPPQLLDLSGDRQLLFPFMTFSCSGTITRLMFLGWLDESSAQFDVARLTSWPYFSLWHRVEHAQNLVWSRSNRQYEEVRQIGPDILDLQMVSLRLTRFNHQLVEVSLTTNVTITAGDVLGVTLQQRYPSPSHGINMTVLKESNGYGKTLVCYAGDMQLYTCNTSFFQETPYIAIKTGEKIHHAVLMSSHA